MGKILKDSSAEKYHKILERNPANKTTKIVRVLSQISPNYISPTRNSTTKESPARKISLKIPTSKTSKSSINKIPTTISNSTSDEQWVDGPRISKSKVAEARYMQKNTAYKKETWIDGPLQLTAGIQSQILNTPQHCSSYGFMDNHKKSMIREWVENQSSQIHRSKNSFSSSCVQQAIDIKVATSLGQFKDLTTFKTCKNSITGVGDNMSLSVAETDCLKINKIEDIAEKIRPKLNFVKIKSNTKSGLNLTSNPLISSLERLSRTLDMLEDDDDEEEIVVPPPLPLIEPLSNGVSREVSMESLNISHKDTITLDLSKKSLSENEILDIVEVNDGESISMQDSCLQVTEEDIALCMREIPISKRSKDDHPLRILSQENLTIVSTFADSSSVLSETGQRVSHIPPAVDMRRLARPYFDYKDFPEQANRHKFDQLARLHELYQNKLALANVTNSLTYQREKSSVINVRQSQTSSTVEASYTPSKCQFLSLLDVPFSDVVSNNGSIYSEPTYIANNCKICDNCRQSMMRSSTTSFWYQSGMAHLTDSRRYCSCFGECNISNLRHPDGASNPNIKEDIEREPGNGASGSDLEETFTENKKLSASAIISSNATFIQNDNDKTINRNSIIPQNIKISNLNKEDYDSGTDSTCRATKLSSANLSRHRAESSGYDSILRDSGTCSIASNSSRQTNILQEHHSGALGVLTSTLCGCFSGGTTGRVRASGSSQGFSRDHTRIQALRREDAVQIRASTHTITWHNVQDSQPSSAPTSY